MCILRRKNLMDDLYCRASQIPVQLAGQFDPQKHFYATG